MRQGPRGPAVAIAALIALAASASAPLAKSHDLAPVRIEVVAQPIPAFERRDPNRQRFGALEFRGGLVLRSDHAQFGGLSGIRVEADGGRFLAVTDRGYWVRGRIEYGGGRPKGIADAEIAPMLAADGRTLAARGWFDTESLEIADGIAYVSIERVNRVVRFDLARYGLAARAQSVAVPAGVRDLPHNRGLEALAVPPRGMPLAGTLIAISERGLDADGNIRGFLIGGPTPGSFAVRRSDEFDITDAVVSPSGALLVLERHFSLMRGVAMRIRSIPLARIKPGALLDGPVLIEAGNGFEIDNMEGIAVHRNAAGETLLTIVSDNNFSGLQRTLLLQFALIGD